MPKNNEVADWKPTATIDHLKTRAQLYKKTRDFFAAKNVLEVETPLLCRRTVTDPFIESIPALVKKNNEKILYYLQTSPEYAMKRLLARGSGSIYQLGKAFRQEEMGYFHNPEFTLLEWYRIGFNHHQLMDEMDEFLQIILNVKQALRITYHELFRQEVGINPHETNLQELKNCAERFNLHVATHLGEIDDWLNLLMTHVIEPKLMGDQVYFIYDFPIFMSALSRIEDGETSTASRFEVYYQGIELANGFHELNDAKEQRKRFTANNRRRKSLGLDTLPIDEEFLACVDHLPDCAGVALGFDRLAMLALNAKEIREVISFVER